MTENDEEQLLIDMYQSFLLKINEYMQQDIEPLAIAAVMLTQSLGIYKTSLSAEDYDAMISNILRLKDDIITFTSTEVNSGLLH